MATKEKVKKKTNKVTADQEKNEERPGSAHSQISVKEALKTVDNTNQEDKNRSEEKTDKEKDGIEQDNVKEKKAKKEKKKKMKDKDQSENKEKGKEKEEGRLPSRQEEAKTLKPDSAQSSLDVPEDQHRSPSPFNKNKVDPGSKLNSQGSAVSLKSAASTVKEAWTDKSSMSMFYATGDKSTKVASLQSPKAACSHGEGRSSSMVTMKESEEDQIAKNAYIPYLYARKSLMRVVDDLNSMKSNHIRIVVEIQDQYKKIENETQSQFNKFVFCLRQNYSDKVKTFRQVIDVHRTELNDKETYWNEMLASLAERNNRLLKDKKVLLIHTKTQIETLEKEKAEIQNKMSEEIDKYQATTGDEKKNLENEIEKYRSENEQLKLQLAGVVVTSEKQDSNTEKEKPIEPVSSKTLAASVVASSALINQEDQAKMREERNAIEQERQKIMQEREQMELDRENFMGGQKKWIDQINMLQVQITENEKKSAEWEAKYLSMKEKAQDAQNLQSKFNALESQYLALSAIVAQSDNAKQITQEESKKTSAERSMMEEEQKKMDKDIEKWESSFKKKNGRAPMESDKSDSIKEMYIQKEELDTMVTSLDTKLQTYNSVENGKVPDPPEVPPVPIDLKEPEVKTVEVKVPDPMIINELENSLEEIKQLRKQISDLQDEITKKDMHITDQNKDLSEKRTKIAQLEQELASLRAGTAVGATGVSNEEVEALKKENKEMMKDIKKLMKKLEKTKTPTDPSDPETKISNLEDKLIDLESERGTLKEENDKLLGEQESLVQQINALTQQLSAGGISPETAVAVGAVGVSASSEDNADLLAQLEQKKKECSEKDMKILEQEQRIKDKIDEIESVRLEAKGMRNDMIKMAKQHAKLQEQVKQLKDYEQTKKLLQAVAKYVHEIHTEVPAAAEGVNTRLVKATDEKGSAKGPYDKAKTSFAAWEDKFRKKHNKDPSEKDRDAEGKKLFQTMEDCKGTWEDKTINTEALKIMKSGDFEPATEKQVSFSQELEVKDETAVEQIGHQLSALDDKVSNLEKENDDLKSERSQLQSKIIDIESKLQEANSQLELQSALSDGVQSDELSQQISRLQSQASGLDAALQQEKNAHNNTKDELENLRKQIELLKEEVENERKEMKVKLDSNMKTSKSVLLALEQELDKTKSRNEELEKERLANVPVDTAKEIQSLQAKINMLEKEKASEGKESAKTQGKIAELTAALESANKNLEGQRALNRENEAKLKNNKTDKDKAIREAVSQVEKREQQKFNEEKKRVAALEKRVKELEMAGAKPGAAVAAVAGVKGGAGDAANKAMKEQLMAAKRENNELNTRIKQLEMEIKKGGAAAGGMSLEDKKDKTRQEKILKELEKKMDFEKKKTERLEDNLKTTEEELKTTSKELHNKENELKKKTAELESLGIAAKQGVEAATKVKTLETDNKKLAEENKVLTENYNSERVLRRKYYNMVEDMKGKIRVYCRARPLSGSEKDRGNFSVLKSTDEYSICVDSSRGSKEFSFDQVFMEDTTQEKVFEDTNNLIQSAVDGYNVCIFAYGQTGSGKTFTMIGDKDGNFPGIAPRAFNRIFDLAQELRNKFTISVSAYMLELYNDKLIDLFAKPGTSEDDKLDIKKDKKGMVFIQGSMVKQAHNAKELYALFDEGSKNRHTASTKMNADSSRSHLVIGIMIESVNKTTGQVMKGKLSLVDLAGSERVGKTGANAEQLKEAMSINKSLSALGDVISALSSDQQFIPYRNNKLTMLMQDSLGGNAKTLMFVNISPADYNQEETVISLMYASRVKLITNDATKNADNKEIARLKSVIAKLKKGESVNEDEED